MSVILKCKWCGNIFQDMPSRALSRLTCSRPCFARYIRTGAKLTDEQRIGMRRSGAWTKDDEILENYRNGFAIMWLARKYKADKRTIRNILKEKRIKEFRGRAGIRAWNKGRNKLMDKRLLKISGENSPNWKGGKDFIMRIRRCYLYTKWVKEVFERDNYTCQICKKRGGNIEADHCPKMFSDLIDEYNIKSYEDALICKELWSTENGRTLCKPCHKTTFEFKGNQYVLK